MLDNSTWDTVSEVLTEDLFYRRDHRLIFRTMEKLINPKFSARKVDDSNFDTKSPE
jgi:replicative DNA helicase